MIHAKSSSSTWREASWFERGAFAAIGSRRSPPRPGSDSRGTSRRERSTPHTRSSSRHDDQRVDASGPELGVEVGLVKPAVAVLVEDDVAVLRLQLLDDVGAPRVADEDPARGAVGCSNLDPSLEGEVLDPDGRPGHRHCRGRVRTPSSGRGRGSPRDAPHRAGSRSARRSPGCRSRRRPPGRTCHRLTRSRSACRPRRWPCWRREVGVAQAALRPRPFPPDRPCVRLPSPGGHGLANAPTKPGPNASDQSSTSARRSVRRLSSRSA